MNILLSHKILILHYIHTGLGAMAEVQTIAEAAADIVSTLDLAEIDKANWRATGKMI